MPLIKYITDIQIDFGASKLLHEACASAGIKRPLVVTDKGVVAAGVAAQALAAGKPVGELEGAEAQVRMLASMSEETQLAFLRSALRDYERASTILDELVQAWATGDVEAIDRIGVEEMRNQSQELYDLILANRNRDWADQIQTMLAASGDTFIAVGAAHLAGDDSVQEILEDRGVRAARVQ